MQLLVYILVYPILWLLSHFPMRLLYFTSDLLYVLIYHIIGYRKKVVTDNLNLIFLEKSSEEIKTISKKFYHHLCDMVLETIKSISISEEQLKKRFVPTNIEVVHAIERQGKDIALMMAHYGSWEWIFILQRYVDYKGYAIYKRLANKYFDAMVKRIRAKYNTELITTKEAVLKINTAKSKGELTLTGFVSDQNPKHHKALHWQEFMGIKVPIHTGAEIMAKKYDMAVLFVDVKKVKRGFYEATFHTITENPKEFEDYQITDEFLKLVEQQIIEAPEYYLWTHKRWKHRDNVPAEFQ